MADLLSDGNTRVGYVAAISNIAAPTVAELNAGILLQDTMTDDGLMGFEADTNEVPTSPLSAQFGTKVAGRDEFSKTSLRFKKQTYGSDTIFSTLTKNTAGYIVIRRGIASTTAWTIGQAVEVYPIVVGREKHITPVPNSVEKWESPTMVSSQPNLRATVA